MNAEDVIKIFKECWTDLRSEYPKYRSRKSVDNFVAYWYEPDIQLHLAHKLMLKLPNGWVHQEALFRPEEARDWSRKRRPLRGRPPPGYYPDITIWDPLNNRYYLLAEVKWAYCTDDTLDLRKWQRGRQKINKSELPFYIGHLDQLRTYAHHSGAVAYICIIDEWYPQISKLLKKYAEPRVRILAEYVDREKIEKFL